MVNFDYELALTMVAWDWTWLRLDDLETLMGYVHRYGYGAVLLGILLENAGIPIPGETITLVGGFLAGSGELNPWYVGLAAFLGAVIGDNLGYGLGVWQGWSLMQRVGGIFGIAEAELEGVRAEFRRNADRAVLLGRFIALLRIFAGPLAGIAGMPYWRFLLFNTLGAAAWAGTMVTLAYFVGHLIPLSLLIKYLLQLAVVALGGFLLWAFLSRRPSLSRDP
ncbi:MAG: DedA family protein [Thermostichales cyanobacterium SZTDM-1c_bins_54]